MFIRCSENKEASKKVAGFTFKSYSGCEVFPLTPDGSVVKQPVTDRDGLRAGMKVSAWDGIWEVAAGEDGQLYLDSSRTQGTLAFDEDSRHCWTCSCLINKRLLKGAVKKVTFIGE